MSKHLKIHDDVYYQLQALKEGRETFTDVVEELLKARITILEAISMLEGVLKYQKYQLKKLDQLRTK